MGRTREKKTIIMPIPSGVGKVSSAQNSNNRGSQTPWKKPIKEITKITALLSTGKNISSVPGMWNINVKMRLQIPPKRKQRKINIFKRWIKYLSDINLKTKQNWLIIFFKYINIPW